jgi:glutathione S-transferase
MNLYYAPGACSQAQHIVLRESGLDFQLEETDLRTKQTKSGIDFLTVNPKGYVPALQLDDGSVLTEGPAISQYIADQVPDSGLAPSAGSFERYRLQEWLNFITSELHKGFSPLFRPDTPEEYKAISKKNLGRRLDFLAGHLSDNDYLLGRQFSVADAYLFVMLTWAAKFGLDAVAQPALQAFLARMRERPAVAAALKAEGF